MRSQLDDLLAQLTPALGMADGGDLGWYQQAIRLPSITTASVDVSQAPDFGLSDALDTGPPAEIGDPSTPGGKFGLAALTGLMGFMGLPATAVSGLAKAAGWLTDTPVRTPMEQLVEAFSAPSPMAPGLVDALDRAAAAEHEDSSFGGLPGVMSAIDAASSLGTFGQESGFGGAQEGGFNDSGGLGEVGGPWRDGGMVFADGGGIDVGMPVRRDDGGSPDADLDRFLAQIRQMKFNDGKGVVPFVDWWAREFAGPYGLARDRGVTQSMLKRDLLKQVLPMLSQSDAGGVFATDGIRGQLDRADRGAKSAVGPVWMPDPSQVPYMAGRNPDRYVEPRTSWRMADGGALSALDIEPGSYVLPSDTVAALGSGSTNAGMRRLGALGALPVHGDGDGRSDDIPAQSAGRPLRLSDGEAVIPPQSVRAMGGPQRLDKMVKRARKRYRQRLSDFGAPRGAGSYAEGGAVGAYNPATGFRQNTVDEPRGAIDALLDYFRGNLRSWTEPAAPGPEAESLSRRNELFGITNAPTNLDVAMLTGFGAPGIMAGPKAKTADLVKLSLAQDMAGKGSSADDILKGTGWFQGADKKWRFEIPDNAAKLTGEQYGPLSDVLNHQELYRAYPEMAGVDAKIGVGGGAFGNYFSGVPGSLDDPAMWRVGRSRDVLSSGLHEAQHGVERIEGFSPGANTNVLRPGTPAWQVYQERIKAILTPPTLDDFARKAGFGDDIAGARPDWEKYVKELRGYAKRGLPTHIDRSAQDYAVQNAYHRAAGEVEARNVQSRMDMTPEQRLAKPPWETEDVARELQIILDNAGVKGPQMSLPGAAKSGYNRPMVDDPGFTIDAYHGTPHADITAFEPGSHFGTSKAANDRVARLIEELDATKALSPDAPTDWNVLPVKLRVQRPIRLEDMGTWEDPDIYLQLYERGMLSQKELRLAEEGRMPSAIDYLRQKGYDAIEYVNTMEDPGSLSYMMLNPANVRSRFAAFDPAKLGSSDLMAGLLPLGLLSATQDEAGR